MKYKIVKAIGLNTDQQAAQTIHLVQDPQNIFLGVLSLVCDDAFTKGRQLLTELSDGFYTPESLNLEEGLNNGEKLAKVYTQAQEKLADCEKKDLLLVVISGKVLYLMAEGDVAAYLKREEQFHSLLQAGSEASLISGFLSEGDLIYLSTTALKDFLADNLPKSLEMDIEVWEEEVSSRIGAAGVHDGLAGLLVKVLPEDISIPSSYNQDPAQESIANKINLKLLFSKFKILLPKDKKIRLVLAILLLLTVLIGGGLKYKQTKDAAKVAEFNVLLGEAQNDFNEKKLDLAKEKLDKALSLIPGKEQAVDLKKRIELEADAILQQYKQAEFPLYLDLNLIKKDLQASRLSLNSGTLLLMDDQTKSLVSVDLAKKSNQILAGSEQLGEAFFASINGSFAFVYSKDKGIIRVDTISKKSTVISKVDKSWVSIVDLVGFAGNVYLLDTGNKIFKYVPTASGYSDGLEYLNKDTKADFANAIRMQIESSIYVLKSGGEILRFTKGVKDHFSLGGLDKGIKDPKSFFVSSETENLYILDSGNSRLVVTGKTGEYKAQYSGDRFTTASDLAVDEKGKKVYLLDGSKIYSMDLK